MLAGKTCSPLVLLIGLAVIVIGLAISLASVHSHNKSIAPEKPMHVQQ